MEGAMRTIHIHRILGMAAILATIGSFLIELRGMLPSTNRTSAEVPGSSRRVCEWTIYEPVIRKLLAEPKPADVERFALLGADPYFTYFYDHETGRVVCVVQSKQKGPLVEASRSEPPDRTRRNVILICLIVLVLSGAGMKIVRMVRAGRSDQQKERSPL
jgi:hypothetical protein